jgi:hypothetical protein
MVSMDPDIAGFDEATADPEWAALAGALRQHYLQAPAPATESRHLAAMAAARPGRRRRRLAVAAAVGAVSLVGGTTLAAAGELPAPVQTGVAALAGHAHISLPAPPASAPPATRPGAGPATPGLTAVRPGASTPLSATTPTTGPQGRGGPTTRRVTPGDEHKRADPPGKGGAKKLDDPGPAVTTPPHPTGPRRPNETTAG